MRFTSFVCSVALAACSSADASQPVLRVCSDPNNLPFSNEKGEGFENAVAQLVANDLGAKLEYTWFPQRRGFIRNTLKARRCDLVIGVPAGYELVAPTRPYYRSTYVFVSRADRHLGITSLDDPRLGDLKIGVQITGDDYENPPAIESLARRGLYDRVVGYTLYGDYSKPNPPLEIVDAVARGDVDLAIVWGPLAGYAAKQSKVPLVLAPVTPASDPPAVNYTFGIAMGVRKHDRALKTKVERVLASEQPAIQKILDGYGVPQLPLQEAKR
jgi:quinoprotein dehydrogenase-associated probable ABC transporter substrate-binding protein